jgi:hypothetical protein
MIIPPQIDDRNPFAQSAVNDDARHDPYENFFTVRLACCHALVLTITPSLPNPLFRLPPDAASGVSSLYYSHQRFSPYHCMNTLPISYAYLVLPLSLHYMCP